jgi:hypothetical protein
VARLKGDFDRTAEQWRIEVELRKRGQKIAHERVHFRSHDRSLSLRPGERVRTLHKKNVRGEEFVKTPNELVSKGPRLD